MKEKEKNLRWGIEQRLEFIEFRLYWEGGINRSDIVEYFGVSVPQASSDLSQYQQLAPKNMKYDRSLKRYFPSASFRPRFFKPDATRFLIQLNFIARDVLDAGETWISKVPDFSAVPVPRRHIDLEHFKHVLRCTREGRSLEIRYQSLSAARPKPIWRRISPHAFGFDGMRWHVRAFCHIDEVFKDFLLSRILGVRKEGEPGAFPLEDEVWNEEIEVELVPHPGLSEEQKRVIASDFGMTQGRLKVSIKLAMLYYLLKRLNLDFEEHKRPAREQHIVLADPETVRTELQRAQGLIAA